MILVGFDFCCGEEGAIAKGEEDASVAQFPKKMSELGLEGLIKAINGQPVDKMIDTGAALGTKENMQNFK